MTVASPLKGGLLRASCASQSIGDREEGSRIPSPGTSASKDAPGEGARARSEPPGKRRRPKHGYLGFWRGPRGSGNMVLTVEDSGRLRQQPPSQEVSSCGPAVAPVVVRTSTGTGNVLEFRRPGASASKEAPGVRGYSPWYRSWIKCEYSRSVAG
jgi:hypothetical protein